MPEKRKPIFTCPPDIFLKKTGYLGYGNKIDYFSPREATLLLLEIGNDEIRRYTQYRFYSACTTRSVFYLPTRLDRQAGKSASARHEENREQREVISSGME
jgi:hypothetical protein